MNKRRHAGFTMMELLVVIAIIGVLSTMLIVAVAGSKEKANIAKCGGNLHNIGIALHQYVLDHDDYLPSVATPTVSWDKKLLRYLGEDTSVFKCPSDTMIDGAFLAGRSPRTYSANGGESGIDNVQNLPFKVFMTSSKGNSIQDVTANSSQVILVGERPGDAPDDRGVVEGLPFCSLDIAAGTIHKKGEGCNYLFADGSTKYMPTNLINSASNPHYWYIRSATP
ncbi:MAG: type II secretion system protein [Spartobacteria bacterium]|nr:type II secretion system protein [Spartobacteria bacterium]